MDTTADWKPRIKVTSKGGAWSWTCSEAECNDERSGYDDPTHAIAVGLAHREIHDLRRVAQKGLHFLSH